MSDVTQANGTRTFRGPGLNELLDTIRTELGPDAVITRQRTGLAGGVGGFFQREFVEVEAQAGPAIRTDVLVGADEAIERPVLDDVVSHFAATPAPADDVAGHYTPAPSNAVARHYAPQAAPFADAAAPAPATASFAAAAPAPAVAAPVPAPVAFSAVLAEEVVEIEPAGFAEPIAPAAESAAPAHPRAVATQEQALVAHGLDPVLARSVVEEAVAHDLPHNPRAVKRCVRRALARRIRTAPGSTGDHRLAITGAPGSGRTTLATRLARAHAVAGTRAVTLVALHADGAPLRAALAGTAVTVLAGDAATVAEALGGRGGLVIVDTPAVSLDPAAAAALAADLGRLGVTEVHAALPATIAPAAARELLGALAPLRPAALSVTHADGTRQLGAPIGVAVEAGLPIAYVAGAGLEVADAGGLAESALP